MKQKNDFKNINLLWKKNKVYTSVRSYISHKIIYLNLFMWNLHLQTQTLFMLIKQRLHNNNNIYKHDIYIYMRACVWYIIFSFFFYYAYIITLLFIYLFMYMLFRYFTIYFIHYFSDPFKNSNSHKDGS